MTVFVYSKIYIWLVNTPSIVYSWLVHGMVRWLSWIHYDIVPSSLWVYKNELITLNIFPSLYGTGIQTVQRKFIYVYPWGWLFNTLLHRDCGVYGTSFYPIYVTRSRIMLFSVCLRIHITVHLLFENMCSYNDCQELVNTKRYKDLLI